MRGRKHVVRATANFGRNLEQIEAFLAGAGAPKEFDRLLRSLADEVIPDLERFPEFGADFLGRAPLSADGRARFAKVLALLGPDASLRQFIRGDFIVLYAIGPGGIHLLAIRHHRQLSFDFPGHWP